MPGGLLGNGIRFGRDGTMFVANYTGHSILRVNPDTLRIACAASVWIF